MLLINLGILFCGMLRVV